MFLRNKKASSPVISAIILIAVTVAVAIAVTTWLGSMTFSFMSIEELKVTNCQWAQDVSYADLTLNNFGTDSDTISKVEVNGVLANAVSIIVGSATLDAGENVIFRITESFVPSLTYEFTVITLAGTRVKYVARAESTSVVQQYASMHYVNRTSNVDGSSDKGTHSNFANQQVGPDSVFDVLTEENTGGSANSTLLDDGFESSPWDVNWNDESSDWREDDSPVHSGSASVYASNGHEGDFTSDSLDASDASAIYVDFWYRLDDTEDSDLRLYFYDGNYYFIANLGGGSEDTWRHYTAKITESQYFVPNFRLRFDATLGSSERVWVDDVIITKEVNADNYELDIEIQFTDIDVGKDYEEICIFMGSATGEALDAYIWNGGSWDTLVTGLTPNQWNNVTRTITEDIVTLRFLGNLETSDTTQDSWEIDCALLYAPP